MAEKYPNGSSPCLSRRKGPAELAIALTALLAYGCTANDSGSYYRVDAIDLRIPMAEGWQQDAKVSLASSEAGGTALRLIRQSAIAGSPRITVEIEPKKAVATRLAPFVEQNLRQMAAMEHGGKISLNKAEKRRTPVGPRLAYRLRHEFSIGQGRPEAISLTQVSLVMVVDGRGVTVTASGRTELYSPLTLGIEQLLDGIRIGTDPKPTSVEEPLSRAGPNGDKAKRRNSKAKPGGSGGGVVDLGTLGGN